MATSASMATMVFLADSTNRAVYKFDAETGEYKGLFAAGFLSGSAPVSMVQSRLDGLMYVGRADGSVLRFDPYTGEYKGILGAGFNSSLVGLACSTDGILYCANSGSTGLILKFEAATGVYQGPIGQWNVNTGGQNTFVDGAYYWCTTTGGQVLKLDRITGQLLASFSPPAPSAPRVMNDLANGQIGYASDASSGVQAGVLRVTQAGEYRGPIAPNWFGAIKDVEVLPDGRTLVDATIIGSPTNNVVGRFDRTTGQYSGLLAANWGLSIVDMEVEQPAVVTGTLTLGDWLVTSANQPVTVDVYKAGTTEFQETVVLPSQPASGTYSLATYYRGAADLYFRGPHWLTKKVTTNILTGGASGVNVTLTNGNCQNADEVVDIADYTILALAFDAIPTSGNWNSQADLNGDEIVDIADYTILALNFDKVGDTP